MIELGTRFECIRSSPRVSGAYQDGTREFTERRYRLAGRLLTVIEKLTGSWEGFGIHPKKIGSGCRWVSEKRTRGVDLGRLTGQCITSPPMFNGMDHTS
ncbi:hypothetical protein GW17_00058616 [Ensete ventricosum]|nr:hypothetical protein GW17_00058616 [Ensete ventricosum]